MTKKIFNNAKPKRFPILFDKWYAILSSALFLLPSRSYVEIDNQQVKVQMAWAFRCHFPKMAIAKVTLMETNRIILSRGVHGWGGRWLVNGSGTGIITFELIAKQWGRMIFFPIKLKQLLVSVEEPMKLMEALKNHL